MKKPFEYYVFIQSGSAFEDKQKAGISHFLEHLVFEYSLSQNKHGIDDFLTKNNIYDEAEVSKYFTFTRFYTLSKDTLEEARVLVKKLINNPDFSQKGFDKQKRVILEEIAYYRGLPFDILDNQFCKTTFEDTGLEHPILGDKNSLNSLELKDLKDWHEEYYTDSKIVEVIFNKESGEIEILAPDNFSKPPALELKNKSNTSKKEQNLDSKGIALGWYLEDPDKKERIILDIIRNIIGASPQSFIYKRLTEELNLIYEFQLYLDHFNGLSVLSPQLFSTQPDKVLKEIEEYKEKVINEGIDNKTFNLAKQHEEHYFSLPEEDAPYTIGKELMKTGDVVMPKERLEILKTIKQEDVEEYMKKLFREEEFRVLIS